MKIKTLHKLWVGIMIMALIGLVALSCRPSSKSDEEPGATVIQETLESKTLPTITPPALGEPTLPPQALQMRVAPTATPSPVPPLPSPTPTPTVTPTPVPITGYDDVPMVKVPAGEFLMGASHEQVAQWREQNKDYLELASREHLYDQTPQLTLYLGDFTIDQFEVTVARYRRCVKAGICQSVAVLETLADDYPVVGVNWYNANAYCRWVGKRLPTEAEWEKAARGADGRWYPWGNEWDESRANRVSNIKDLQPVGSYPTGASPYDVLDMGGNAVEWTADLYSPYPEQTDFSIFSTLERQQRVVRGRLGAPVFAPGGPGGTTTYRSHQRPDDPREPTIGFRCAQGPEQDWRNQVMHTSLPLAPEPVRPDLSQMSYVPAGELIMGIGAEANSDSHIGSPAHVVYLDDFYIDRYEVTVAEYVEFLNTLGANHCAGYLCIYENSGEGKLKWINTVGSSYQAESGFEDRPAVHITWWGAQAYCHWRGKRLPTEAEWEKAARGTDGRLYPWGNEWVPDRAAAPGKHFGIYPLPVGTHPDDVSPYGVYDTLGNAEEWVADWYLESYYSHSPYANPQGPEDRYGDLSHVARGAPGAREREGLVIRRSGGGSYVGFRCACAIRSP